MSDKELIQQAKKYLVQIREIDQVIQRLRFTIDERRSIPTSQNSILRPYKVQTSNEKIQRKDAMPEMIDLEEQVNSRIARLITLRNEAFAMIGNVPNFTQQNILIARYIQGKKWDDIAEELKFSTKWVLKLHRMGVLAFARTNQEFLMEWQNKVYLRT